MTDYAPPPIPEEAHEPLGPPDTALGPPVPPRKRPGWLIPVIVGAAAVLVAGGALVVFMLARGSGTVPLLDGETELRKAYKTCGQHGEISDGDRTLFLDLGGKDSGSGSLDVTELACVLVELETPSYVTTAMQQTRALDGRLSETWGNFEATWSYHPDNGLDVVIREH